MRWTGSEGKTWSLHEACYEGRLDAVTALLDAGADPSGPAAGDDRYSWVSCAGPQPRPLNCVAIAWAHVSAHVEIVKLLVARGAVIDETVIKDYCVETTMDEDAVAVGAALGILAVVGRA